MKALVIYDTLYNNTENIARAIGEGVGEEAEVLKVSEVKPEQLGSYPLLIVGSPTQGGRHTKPMQEFLGKVPDGALKDIRVAAFDTRVKSKWVKIFGYAAGRIADELKKKGGNLVAPPEPFYVVGTRGPLVDGELDRANEWAEKIVAVKE